MNRKAKDFVLVAWKDSDVSEMIKDKSYAGKLAPTNKGEKDNKNFLF